MTITVSLLLCDQNSNAWHYDFVSYDSNYVKDCPFHRQVTLATIQLVHAICGLILLPNQCPSRWFELPFSGISTSIVHKRNGCYNLKFLKRI